MSDEVQVRELPMCNICSTAKATYDGATKLGPWANMCPQCFAIHGVGLGTGRGQRLVVRNAQSGTWLDKQDSDKVETALAQFRESSGYSDTMRYAADDERFGLWLHIADLKTVRGVGVSIFDLSDWAWRDAYDNGTGPTAAAREALSEDETFSAMFD